MISAYLHDDGRPRTFVEAYLHAMVVLKEYHTADRDLISVLSSSKPLNDMSDCSPPDNTAPINAFVTLRYRFEYSTVHHRSPFSSISSLLRASFPASSSPVKSRMDRPSLCDADHHVGCGFVRLDLRLFKAARAPRGCLSCAFDALI